MFPRLLCTVFVAGALGAFAIGASDRPVDAELTAVAGLPGEPHTVSAAGVTRGDTRLSTVEDPRSFDAEGPRRAVIVGGLDGDADAARAVLDAVRWFKIAVPSRLRREWTLSALPLADPDNRSSARPFEFPPVKGFFDDPEQPESRYVWRWIAYQAPDLVVELRRGGGESPLTRALSGAGVADLGTVPASVVAPAPDHNGRALERLLEAARRSPRSPLHQAIAARAGRAPVDLARVLAKRYPETPGMSYIPAVAWANTLRLAAATGDEALRAKVHEQVKPWLSGEKKALAPPLSLTSISGVMIFGAMAREDGQAAARALAAEAADLAGTMKNGVSAYARGWTDDMFMATTMLASASTLPGREHDLDAAAALLTAYVARLQRPDGIFVHAMDAPVAWGRGNGFASLGLIEALTAMPAGHAQRPALLAAYTKQMAGVRAQQAPDGTWREIVDEPGAYREESATAMLMTSMARGIRLGWLDQSYRPVVDRAWRALAAHVGLDGTIVDICTSTGAGPTRRYYYDRPAVSGADDRGGAMALLASVERMELTRR